jgi:hypothetical protein
MISAPLPTWSAAPSPQPIPGSPGHYQLGDQLITTTFRQIIEEVFPDFRGLEPSPVVRQALAQFLKASTSPEATDRLAWRPPPGLPVISRMVEQITTPHLWAPYAIVAAPLTMATQRPLAAGSADALVLVRATQQHALVLCETTPRSLAVAHKQAFLSHLGAHVAAASDAFRLWISHVIMVWASPTDCTFEFISPDRCLDAWVSAADFHRWRQRNLPPSAAAA